MQKKENISTIVSTGLQRIKDRGIKLRRVKRVELKIAILDMVDGGSRRYGKRFFRPTLVTMVFLLAERQHIETSLRSLSRAIRELVDERKVWRKNRHTKGKGIKMLCRATAYYLLDKGREVFRKMLKRAQWFLRPLGVPKVALDNVTPKRVFSTLGGLEGLSSQFNPPKGRASPVQGIL